VISKSGAAILKTDKSLIKSIDIEIFLPNYKNILSSESQEEKKHSLNPEQHSVNFNNKRNITTYKDVKTLKGRL
jgi:hypothetical protein